MREKCAAIAVGVAVGILWMLPRAASASYMSAVIADSPIAYYRLGEASGTTMATAVNSPTNNGSYVGAPTLGVTGAVSGDTAMRVNGSQYGLSPFLFDPSATSWTLEFWAKPEIDQRASQVTLIGQQNGTGTGRSWIYETPSGGLSSFFNATQQDWGGGALALNIYTFISMTYDSSTGTIRWYKNGVLNASYVATIQSANGGMVIGDDKLGNVNGGMVGSLDEVALFTTRLSDAQIQAHFDAVPEPVGSVALALGAIILVRRRDARA